MKKLSKAILLALGALLVLVVFGLVCVNLYIQSPRAQEQMEEQLSKALHMPLKIINTSLSPWSGLRVTGITIPNGDTTFLEAGTFTASYRALPLLAGRLLIPEMSVDRPRIVWKQDAEGKWKLPAREKTASVPDENKAPGKTSDQAPETPKPEKKSEGGFKVVVERFLVKGGTVDLVDKDGKHTAVFTDVNMTYTALTEEKVEGTAVIGRAVWADTLALENVRTPFTYAGGELTLPELTATLGGGPVRGSYRAQPDAPKSPFEAAFTFEKVNLDRVAGGVGLKPGQVGGTAAGQLTLRGDMRRAERAEGGGQIQLTDGRFQQLELFQTIGQVLNIRELSDLRLKDAHGDFRIGGEKVVFDQLALNAANLQLSAKGTVRFDQKVAFDARLSVEDKIVKQLPDLVRDGFGTADNGLRTIDFNVTGTTEKLRTNLMDKLIGGQNVVQQVGKFATELFGGKNKDEEDKKKKEEERAKEERRAEKKRKLEQDKAAARKPAAVPATPPPAPAAPTTAITPVKP